MIGRIYCYKYPNVTESVLYKKIVDTRYNIYLMFEYLTMEYPHLVFTCDVDFPKWYSAQN